jgi:hypothetical protein
MRRRLLLFAAAFAALPAGIALATVADGNFLGAGTDQPKALFTMTVSANKLTHFTWNHVKFTCTPTAHGHTGPSFITGAVPFAVDNSFTFKFESTDHSMKGKGSGFVKAGDAVAKGTFQENLILNASGNTDPNGPYHCATGKVDFKLARQ